MAKHSAITVQVRIAWWLKWYMAGVIMMCRLTGLDFDEAKVGRYVRRALTTKVIRHPVEEADAAITAAMEERKP